MKKDQLTLKTNILREIFNIAPKKYKVKEEDHSKIAKKFYLSTKEIDNNLDFLFEMGLIRKTPGPNYKDDRIFEWMITDKGLDYLEKKQVEQKQIKFNEIVAFTGTLIALVTIYGFIINATNLQNYPANYWIVTVVFLALVVSCLGPLAMIIFNFWKELINRK
jgi:DNA-binding MarR family transcriptional regulator